MNDLAKYLLELSEEHEGSGSYENFYSLPVKKQVEEFFTNDFLIDRIINWCTLTLSSNGRIAREDIRDAYHDGFRNVPNTNTFKIQCLQILRGGNKSVRHHFKGVEGFDG